jgi:hypothetical protein
MSQTKKIYHYLQHDVPGRTRPTQHTEVDRQTDNIILPVVNIRIAEHHKVEEIMNGPEVDATPLITTLIEQVDLGHLNDTTSIDAGDLHKDLQIHLKWFSLKLFSL